MPRLTPQLIRRALNRSPELAALLPTCRDLVSASNELRWLQEHVDKVATHNPKAQLTKLCHQRGRGVPLQYLLGTQPFGSLDIKCKPGVLIPRGETEAYTCHLRDLLKSGSLLGRRPSETKGLRIIDFCSGTGCIPLLLFSAFQSSVDSLHVYGMDISPVALRLAQENIGYNIKNGYMRPPKGQQSLFFQRGDVFSNEDINQFVNTDWDVMISNPPYISKEVWNFGQGQLGYSVRKYEPRLALVPQDDMPSSPPGLQPEDIFYARLVDVAHALKPKVLLMEVGDEQQAHRVIRHCHRHTFCEGARLEIWRDWPDIASEDEESNYIIPTSDGQGHSVPVKGAGNVRSVAIIRSV